MTNKKSKIHWLLTAMLLVVAMAMPTPALAAITLVEPTKGDGTSDNPYQISTAAELYWFADKVNNDNANYSSKNAVLIADIDLEGSATNKWTPIGNTTNQFKGTFDGGGHKITGLYINRSGNSNGLFGYLGEGGVIKNLGVDGSVHISGNNIGGVCGYSEGTITGCYNNGAVTGNGATGGVCGYNDGTMENCYNRGAVNGYDEVGGVCGHSEGTITGCYNTGTVTGTYRFTGGVCGRTGAKTTIACCYNTGAVTGTNTYMAATIIDGEDYSARGVGGICGYNCGGAISNSYNAGSVTGKKIVGGVCGYNTNYSGMSVLQRSKGTLKYCYNTGTISDEEPAELTEPINAGGVCGKNDNGNSGAITNCYRLSVSDITPTKLNDLGTAISAEEFADRSKFSEWDFSATWEIIDFWGRPTLRSIPEIEGNGTETEPYPIPDLATLESLRNAVNAGRDYSGMYFTLTADIDMSGKYGIDPFKSLWTPIGSAENQFKGTFDGGGHKITGLYTRGSTGFRGLFGYLGEGGVIKNLGVEGTVTDTGSNCGSVGGVCGYSAGTITGCYNKATVKGSYESVGGVCGKNGGTITSCYNNGDVSSTGSNLGGVCGMNHNTITDCYNTGTVSGIDRVGGVCGYNDGNTFTDCYNTSTVSGTSEVGGVCGLNISKTITDCYNTGTVSGTGSNIGGVCGYSEGTITSCYYLSGCNGEGTTFNDLGTAISAADFVAEKTFVDWDFTNIWEISGWIGRPMLSSIPETNYKGAGTETNPISIPDLERLEMIRDEVNASRDFSGMYFTMTADIDMSGTYNSGSGESWTPIGKESTQFKGVFDGAGHKISGLYISNSEDFQGLFGYLGQGGVIKNLGVEGTVIGTGSFYQSVGGVCGYNEGTMENCYNTGAVNGYDKVGGVCGYNKGTITNCYNTGAVNGHKDVGGVCGYNTGTITNCYNTGAVNGYDEVGGVCGYNTYGGTATIMNCYYNSDNYTGNAIGTNKGTANNVEGKTATQFKSGEVAYLLSQGTEGSVWGQQLGTDDYPVLSDYKVIKAAKGDKDANENDTYWATFSNWNSDATLLVPSARNLNVYNATVSSGTMTLKKRTDNQVAKGEGVLLKTDGEYVNVKANETDGLTVETYANNNLVATPATEQTIDAETGYTLYRLTYNKVSTMEGLGFYLGLVKHADGSVASSDGSQLKATPGKAYLKVTTEAATKPASAALTRGFVFSGDDETTAIDEIVIEGDAGISGTANADGRIYNLQGQQVSAPAKGLYIKNNKKVLIK